MPDDLPDVEGSPVDPAAPPTWLEEMLELLQTRRRLAVAVAVVVSVAGLLVTAVAPGVLPPTAGVGAAVGVAACLLAVAAVIGLDAGDLDVQGARHVRAAGADVAVVLRGPVDGEGAVGVVDRLDATGATKVAVVPADPASRDEVEAIVDGLAEAWARTGRRVLVVDVATADPRHAGIVEVARGDVVLGEAVRFDDELMLARLGAGSDLETALVELPGLTPRLPADIERTLIAVPPLVDPAARTGAAAVEDVLVLAIAGRTSRVDLLATLEALDVVGVDARVLLHRPADRLPTVLARRSQTAPATASDEDRTDPGDVGDEIGPDDVHDGDDGVRVGAPVGVEGQADTDAWFDDGAGFEDTGPLEPIAAAPSTRDAETEQDDPRGDDPGTDDAGIDVDEPTPSAPALDRPLVDPSPTTLLGLADIEREVEEEARAAAAALGDTADASDDELTDAPDAEDAVAVREEGPSSTEPGGPAPRPAPAASEGAPEPDREPDAGWLHDSPAARDLMVAGASTDPSSSDGRDSLTTTAVLEALAQEIWERDEQRSSGGGP